MAIRRLPQTALFLKAAKPMSKPQQQDITEISRHILATGLLNPLIVTPQNGHYIVVDGQKRLRAIQLLARHDLLPRSLSKIPCIVTHEAVPRLTVSSAPSLMSNQDRVHGIITGAAAGMTPAQLRHKYCCGDSAIAQALSLQNLHPKLMLAFNNSVISLPQAAAFASLPNMDSQWELLVKLGPFVSDVEIMKAIETGHTVITLPGGDVMLMPSRPRRPLRAPARHALPMAA